jgi:ribosomal protein S18 acetylase RimI-like enzyme
MTSWSFRLATIEDAPVLAALHTATAEHLTQKHGQGPWSSRSTDKGVILAMRTSKVYVARIGREIVATLRLATKKPWAIDVNYFQKCRRPLYLLGMAVSPAHQRQAIGRRCMEEASRTARELQADAIRLDAYNAPAGAGGFYAKCGYREVGRVTYRNAPLIYYELMLT